MLLKRILINILVVMVVVLPLRNVLAVPMTMSPDHCAVATTSVEMAVMDHAGHNMPAKNFYNAQQDQQVSACTCFNQCDAECSGCIHIVAAITFDILQLSEIRSIELVSVSADSLLNRTLSPPSRPPLTL